MLKLIKGALLNTLIVFLAEFAVALFWGVMVYAHILPRGSLVEPYPFCLGGVCFLTGFFLIRKNYDVKGSKRVLFFFISLFSGHFLINSIFNFITSSVALKLFVSAMFGGFIGIFIREISFPAKKYVVVVLILISLLLVLSPLQPLLKSEQQEKTLIEYIRNDETEKVKALIEKGADVNQTDETGVTPIMWAAYNGNEGIINFLVKNGADVRKEGFLTIEEEDLKFTVFISPLDAASAKGRLEAVKYLIEEAGLKPDENPGCFNNLLLKEKDIVNFDKVVEVLEKTDHRHVKKLREFYPFAKNDYPISQNEASFLNAMYLMTVKFDLVNEKYDKFLLRRIANNRKKIDEMFKGGIRKAESYEFFIGENGETPLITAIREWHGDVAAYLLSKGADANYKDCSGNTPLSVARKEKRPELIEMLLKNGAKE